MFQAQNDVRASVARRREPQSAARREGPEARWALYSQPLEFREPVTLLAKAIRYGYEESDETRRTLA